MRKLVVVLAVAAVPGASLMVEAQREGEIGTIRLPDAGTFGFRPTVRDAASGRVTVAILGGGLADDPVLAELEAIPGESPVEAGTTPSFTIAITRILER